MQQKLLAKAVADLQRNSTLSMQYASMQYAELAGDLAALAADLSKVGARVARWEWLAGGVDGTLPGGGGGVLGRPLALGCPAPGGAAGCTSFGLHSLFGS